jgi:hypothetical protein
MSACIALRADYDSNELRGLAMCGRLPVGKGFFDSNATLVGAAMCPACLRGADPWPLAIMLSADQVPVKSTQSRCCIG